MALENSFSVDKDGFQTRLCIDVGVTETSEARLHKFISHLIFFILKILQAPPPGKLNGASLSSLVALTDKQCNPSKKR